MLPKLSQCTTRFVYVLSPPVLHQLKCNLYHVNLCYRSFQMRYNMTYRMQTAIAPMTVKDRITKHWDSFGSHCSFDFNCRQTCSIGFRSGLCGGQSFNTDIPLSDIHLVVYFDLCFGSLSC